MADVKWIKITTDMFDNRKIKHLRRLPDGDSVVLIWVMLLTMAGRCNANGMIFLTENIPYTTKMLADELDFEENTVLMALDALSKLNMIVNDGSFFWIAGWDEYQNTDRLQEIREYNKIAKQKSREKKKLLHDVNDMSKNVNDMSKNDVNDMSMTCQSCQAIEEDKESRNKILESREYSRMNAALDTASNSYEALCKQYGKAFVDERIERAKQYPGTTINTVEKWCKEDFGKKKPSKNKFNDFPQREYDMQEMEKKMLARQKGDIP